MAHTSENPASAKAPTGSVELSLRDVPKIAENLTQTQVNSEIDPAILCWSLVENIGANTERWISQMDAALAMGKAGSAPGFLHGLRRAREVWAAISLDAKKFGELTGSAPL